MEPWARTPRTTGFDWKLPHFQALMSFWEDCIDTKADFRDGTVTAYHDKGENLKFKVGLNEVERFSDHETHEFWPDVVSDYEFLEM